MSGGLLSPGLLMLLNNIAVRQELRYPGHLK